MSTVGATLSPYFFHSGQPWRRGDLLHSLSHLMYRELQPCSRQRVAARCASRAGCPNLVQVGLRKSEDKVTQWRTIADLASWPRVVSCAAGRSVDFERSRQCGRRRVSADIGARAHATAAFCAACAVAAVPPAVPQPCSSLNSSAGGRSTEPELMPLQT